MKHTLALLTALLLTPLAPLHAADAPKPESKPNVLILLVDDMGYGAPRCFNAESKIATPHIDRLAREGMRFTDAHAPASICVPSRYGLLTGRMPYRNWSGEGTKGAKKQAKNGRAMLHFPQPQLQHEPQRLNLATLMKRQGLRFTV
jgi:arylsulfatase A-like enzyme